MKIKRLSVHSLFGNLDFEWLFNEDINILAGINGSYKTTLLNILWHVTNHEEVEYPVSLVEAEYFGGLKLTYTREVKDLKSLLTTRDSNKMVVDMIQKEHPEWVSGGNAIPNVQVAIKSYREEINGRHLEKNEYESIKRIDFISTFDVASDHDKESVLNAELLRLKERYAFYLSDLSKQVSNLLKVNGSVSREQVDAINKHRDEFVTIVNDAFTETGKTLSETESDLSFVLSNGKHIQPQNLSAGEKQLLIIFLTVLLEKRQEYILIMDEPEISIHIDMQYSLIDNLRKLNPQLQLILSTHSPAIFGAGWGEKVVYADRLLKK